MSKKKVQVHPPNVNKSKQTTTAGHHGERGLHSTGVEQRMTAEPRCWGGVSHPLQLTTGLVIKSVTTSPTLAGEHMLFILKVSIVGKNHFFTFLTLA